jgi:hypothetical protein
MRPKINVEDAVSIKWLSRTLAPGISEFSMMCPRFWGMLKSKATSKAVHQALSFDPKMTGSAQRVHIIERNTWKRNKPGSVRSVFAVCSQNGVIAPGLP